jgi:FKBP-type peptidyl-prolyl cis-trans isomerase/thiol-disulfide isomerase/thioredoxin
MIRSKIIAISILFFYTSIVIAQQTKIGLKIGDKVPDFLIPKLIHYKTKKAAFSDFSKGLLIIDFWGRGCSTCIESLPKMELLEKKFKKNLIILPVTEESEEDILLFWKRNRYTKDLKTPSVVEDKTFKKYFNHKYIPHEVWIYNGIIIGITSLEYVDEYNISQVLKSAKVDWPIKNDFYTFNRNKPLFSFNKDQIDTSSSFASYAAISDFREETNSPIWMSGGAGVQRDSVKKNVRAFFVNQPILNSYLNYYSMLIKPKSLVTPYYAFQPNQIEWDVFDKSKYVFTKNFPGQYSQNWLKINGICFESVYPDSGQSDSLVYQSIIKDLNRLLGLNVRWKKKMEKVLMLRKIDGVTNPAYNKNRKGAVFSLYDIIYNMNEDEKNPYIFDESGNNRIEVMINLDTWNNIDSINNDLKRAGYQLFQSEMLVDKLVFSEVGNKKLVNRKVQDQALRKSLISEKMQNPSPQDNQEFMARNKINNNVIVTPSGLQYKIIIRGEGSIAELNDKVLIDYEGSLINGKTFDSSYELGHPVEIKVNEVVEGLSEALRLMPMGSEWEVYIPANLGYGNHTGNGKFPPNSPLIFRVKMHKIYK